MNGKKLLLVEDNEKIQQFNKPMLENRGFTVYTAMTLAEAWEYMQNQAPDAIVLDIGMPDGNGLDFLRQLRRGSSVPVLLLTGYSKDEDILAGFEGGCNDYLPKPYTFDVFYARLNCILRDAERVPETIIRGPLTVKPTSMTAYVNGVDLQLSQKEFVLLQFFLQNEGRVMEADYIYAQVWERPMLSNMSALKFQISRLRGKIAGSGYVITSNRGQGYCFEHRREG